jgi:superfamily II DNA/RNA helicase
VSNPEELLQVTTGGHSEYFSNPVWERIRDRQNSFFGIFACSRLNANLSQNGFDVPTTIQAAAIGPALAGKDLIATAQTGTGKTLAFVLPVIQLLTSKGSSSGIRSVILSPTRELALQINDTFVKIAVLTACRLPYSLAA